MAQLSRPFQIALLAVGLLAAAWFFALRGHPASTGGSSAPTSASPAPSAPSQSQKAAAPSPVYHGPAPGVEGLTRAIARAHAAVAASQQNAKQLGEKSAQASSPTSAGAASGASTTGSQASSATTSKGTSATHPVTRHLAAPHKGTSTSASAPARGSGHTASPSMQAAVEGELKQGKVVTILFWNPRASVDAAVQRELQAVGHASGGKVVVHDARASQVGSFGSITHAVQVLQTPTILIVNKHGQTTTLTGLTDAFSLAQAIDEARHA